VGDGPTLQGANPLFRRTLQSPTGATQRLGIEGEGLAQRAEFEATVVEATQQHLVAPRQGIVGDDLDDFEAVVDQKLMVFLIVADGEQGIAQIGVEDQVTGGRQGVPSGRVSTPNGDPKSRPESKSPTRSVRPAGLAPQRPA
jgi:hypothetical protein